MDSADHATGVRKVGPQYNQVWWALNSFGVPLDDRSRALRGSMKTQSRVNRLHSKTDTALAADPAALILGATFKV
jgi:hypothetical protein